MDDTVLTKQKSKSTVQDSTTSSVSTEIDKVIIGSIAAFAGVVGLWSIACLASAMFQAGGPLQLAGGWLKAVSGM
ncbi:hypothetical protein UWK_02212 [Desulfocapsa sulfexigens DSM 10523]|uniref:Uncharacterized protein n=1 Tax=Desulfocapsa sulfexigens (strain DSM 10523 / SB164P1) TaxID=1167006 RepID=M1P5I4_DESSD|nr:hypothetical protein [Desulfocapsa sulfexigens]AGF78753.1 hypothetical protein UWK_02212 [Desulfocapsa sulfexigens DSM 10523]